ncbi:spore coat protein U domain-containing protein [Alcanivorax sediminis]|uniref:Spore coat protein U/FanG domain-containing protein n=1 Tax=Alcanivorax sediminis TaxID=2663008 RepID=A0A6N7LYT5_9GAMM|nr:fimbrial major subunit CsuA/B family protein [Alcanivorax sediminis]MQX54586.1 hypothetical protein [Alcanivorax sediminis]
MMKATRTTFLLTALIMLPASGQAETAKNHFLVHLSVLPSCYIDSTEFIAAGIPVVNPSASQGKLDVACSNGVSYEVGLSGPNNIRTIRSAHGSTSQFEIELKKRSSLDWHTNRVLGSTGAGLTVSHQVITPASTNPTASTLPDNAEGILPTGEITITLTF